MILFLTSPKKVVNGIIYKQISFEAENQKFVFTEQVQALKIIDFEFLLQKAGFQVDYCFGNYNLDLFDIHQSERLILIASKI